MDYTMECQINAHDEVVGLKFLILHVFNIRNELKKLTLILSYCEAPLLKRMELLYFFFYMKYSDRYLSQNLS